MRRAITYLQSAARLIAAGATGTSSRNETTTTTKGRKKAKISETEAKPVEVGEERKSEITAPDIQEIAGVVPDGVVWRFAKALGVQRIDDYGAGAGDGMDVDDEDDDKPIALSRPTAARPAPRIQQPSIPASDASSLLSIRSSMESTFSDGTATTASTNADDDEAEDDEFVRSTRSSTFSSVDSLPHRPAAISAG